MTQREGRLLRSLALSIATAILSGCVSAPSATGRYAALDAAGRYVMPIGGAPVIANETPYSGALRCMAAFTALRPLRIAVGQIADDTGQLESGNNPKITQGGALMAMSALAKAGVPLVERLDIAIAELELKYANENLSGDEKAPPIPGDDRRIFAGSIPGSDYYLVGGITELNFNIHSKAGTAGTDSYVMNIGLDLRLVDSNTLEVVDVISYQKQIVAHRDRSAGDSALEPIQLAVRSTIERAVLEMVTRLYKVPASACTSAVGISADPLARPGDRLRTGQSSVNTSMPALSEAERSDAVRRDPNLSYSSSDRTSPPELRGREY